MGWSSGLLPGGRSWLWRQKSRVQGLPFLPQRTLPANQVLGRLKSWVGILPPLLISCVTLGKLFSLSEPLVFPQFKSGADACLMELL